MEAQRQGEDKVTLQITLLSISSFPFFPYDRTWLQKLRLSTQEVEEYLKGNPRPKKMKKKR
jgi:hypothetical protein